MPEASRPSIATASAGSEAGGGARTGPPLGPDAGRRARMALLLCVILLPMAILVAIAPLSWRAVRREAQAELSRAADVVAEYGLRALTAYGAAAGRLDELMFGLAEAEPRHQERALHLAFGRLQSELPELRSGFALNREGVPLPGGGAFPPAPEAWAAGQDAVAALRGPDAPALHVDRVRTEDPDAAPLLAIARRRRAAADAPAPEAFRGAVGVLFEADALSRGLRRLLGGGDVLALIRADGEPLAGTAAAGGRPRLPAGASPLDGPATPGADATGATPAAAPDGARHLVAALRRLDGLPVHAAALRPRAGVLARWGEAMLPPLAVALAATLLLLTLAMRLRRGERRLLEADATLERRVVERTAPLAELSEALDLTPCLVLGLDGTMRHWSAGCERLYGFTRAEAVGRVASALLCTEWPAGGRAAIFETLHREGEWHGELRQRARDGSPVLTAAHWILRRHPTTGEPSAIVSTRADLTALRRTETALRATEARLRQAQEASGVVPFEVTPGGVALSTDAHLALYGLPPGTRLDAAAFLARVHPQDRQAVVAEHEALAHDGGAFEREFRVVLPDGRIRWLLSRGEAVANPAGGPMPLSIMGINLDVTARKQSEAALAESEARLRLAQEAAGLGIFDHDLVTGQTTWDARLRAIWGLPEGVEATRRTFLQGLHPGDRPLRRSAAPRPPAPCGPAATGGTGRSTA
jgi:PAS domain S-box-containing protein